MALEEDGDKVRLKFEDPLEEDEGLAIVID